MPNDALRDIFFAPEIEKGRVWFEETRHRLAEVDAALIWLTPETLHSPWIHFEAGTVLGRLERTRVFPFLFDVPPEDIEGPLSIFQGTSNTKEDTRRLARDLRRLTQLQPEDPSDYAAVWTKFKEGMDELRFNRISQVMPKFSELFPFLESDAWLDRYSGARETLQTLQSHKATVDRICEPYQKEL